MQTRRMLLSSMAAVMVSGSAAAQSETTTDSSVHVEWVAQIMRKMMMITPGATRKMLLMVFKGEGGISTPLQRTFVSRDCPYFKVDVQFHAVGRPERDAEGRVTMLEGDEDTIAQISRPYLQYSVMD